MTLPSAHRNGFDPGPALMAVGLAVVLGGVGVGLDLLFERIVIDGFSWLQLVAVLTTGMAWAAGAAYAGWRARGFVTAAVLGALVLAGAVVVYYGLILGFETRLTDWAAVSREGGLWLLVGVPGGVVLGVLGRVVAQGTGLQRAIAVGLLAGMFAAQGVAFWMRAGIQPEPVTTATVLASVGLVAVAWRRGVPLVPSVGTFLATAVVGGLAWGWFESLIRAF